MNIVDWKRLQDVCIKSRPLSINTKGHKHSPQSAGPAEYLPEDRLETDPRVSTMQIMEKDNPVQTTEKCLPLWPPLQMPNNGRTFLLGWTTP